MKDTLATLDLTEKPGQRLTTFRHVRHYQQDGPVETEPGERIFSSGPQHGFYSYTKETPMPVTNIPHGGWTVVMDEHIHDACLPPAPARLETDSAKRKEYPIYSGVIRYFPDALAEVARLSHAGNEKHNPGEPLHWARSKSTDQLDCLVRHLAEAGTVDADGILHDVKIVWRALANLQTLLERVRGLPISPGSKP